MPTVYTGRKKHRSNGKLWIFLVVSAVVLTLLVIYLLVLYFRQPFRIKNAYSLADSAIISTIGDTYVNRRYLTRQEVIQIVSDVFWGLKQKGFGKTESVDATIEQALHIKMLEGDGTSLYLEREATKQDSLVFIARGLGILEDLDVDSEPVFEGHIMFDRWAKPQIEGLVIQSYFSTSEISKLYDLRETITASELKMLLDRIVEVKTRPMSFFQFIVLWAKNNPILSVVIIIAPLVTITIVPAFVTLLGFAFQISDRIQQSTAKRREKSRRMGTICLAGTTSVGKSTLKTKMTDPAKPLYSVREDAIPTRTYHAETIELRAYSGNIVFEGIIIDVPGSSPQDVFQFLSDPYKNKILLLVLAHTKANEDKQIDQNFVQEQFIDIQKTWVPAIRAHGRGLNKIVVLINKIDLLPQECLPAQLHIYGEHFKLLCEAAKDTDVRINAVEASSFTGTNLGALYEQLSPLSD